VLEEDERTLRGRKRSLGEVFGRSLTHLICFTTKAQVQDSLLVFNSFLDGNEIAKIFFV
jgi:hypothetical protein